MKPTDHFLPNVVISRMSRSNIPMPTLFTKMVRSSIVLSTIHNTIALFCSSKKDLNDKRQPPLKIPLTLTTSIYSAQEYMRDNFSWHKCRGKGSIEKMQIARFGLVGGIATIIHLAFAATLLKIAPALPTVIINSIAFTIAFAVSFLGHRYFTFGRQGSLLKYFASSVFGLAVNNSVVLTVIAFGGDRFLAIVVGTLIAPLAVFILAKYWAFREK